MERAVWVLGSPAGVTLTSQVCFLPLLAAARPSPLRPCSAAAGGNLISLLAFERLVYAIRCQHSRIQSNLSGLNCPYAVWTAPVSAPCRL